MVSMSDLEGLVLNWNGEVASTTSEIQVSNLLRKLGCCTVATVPGLGTLIGCRPACFRFDDACTAGSMATT